MVQKAARILSSGRDGSFDDDSSVCDSVKGKRSRKHSRRSKRD